MERASLKRKLFGLEPILEELTNLIQQEEEVIELYDMKCSTPKAVASKISVFSPRVAAQELIRLKKAFDDEYVSSILAHLQDYARFRRRQNDTWWLEMMHRAGPEISELF